MSSDELLFNVTLRIFHEDIEPDVVSSLLSCDPSFAYRRGDVVGSHGRAASTVRKHGCWVHERRDVPSIQLSDTVCAIAALVSPAQLQREPLSQYEIDLWISSLNLRGFNNGFQLDPDALAALAIRKWPLVFDLYCACEEA